MVIVLSKQQVSNLRKELRQNHTVNNAVTLSAEKRSTKIAKLQQYLDTKPKVLQRLCDRTNLKNASPSLG